MSCLVVDGKSNQTYLVPNRIIAVGYLTDANTNIQNTPIVNSNSQLLDISIQSHERMLDFGISSIIYAK